MNLGLLIFKDNLFVLRQLDTFSNSIFIVSKFSLPISVKELTKLVSSAYFMKWKKSLENWMSLMYKMNNKGPNIDP